MAELQELIPEEKRAAVHMAVLLNARAIPPLKRGKGWSEPDRDEKLARFADAFLAHLGRVRFFRTKPQGDPGAHYPAPGHSAPAARERK